MSHQIEASFHHTKAAAESVVCVTAICHLNLHLHHAVISKVWLAQTVSKSKENDKR